MRDVGVQINVIVESGALEIGDGVMIQVIEPLECEDEHKWVNGWVYEDAGESGVDYLEMLFQNVLWDILDEYVNWIVAVENLSYWLSKR